MTFNFMGQWLRGGSRDEERGTTTQNLRGEMNELSRFGEISEKHTEFFCLRDKRNDVRMYRFCDKVHAQNEKGRKQTNK